MHIFRPPSRGSIQEMNSQVSSRSQVLNRCRSRVCCSVQPPSTRQSEQYNYRNNLRETGRGASPVQNAGECDNDPVCLGDSAAALLGHIRGCDYLRRLYGLDLHQHIGGETAACMGGSDIHCYRRCGLLLFQEISITTFHVFERCLST